jgi:hypothetical protein
MEISGSLSMIITWMSLGTCGTMMGKMKKDIPLEILAFC